MSYLRTEFVDRGSWTNVWMPKECVCTFIYPLLPLTSGAKVVVREGVGGGEQSSTAPPMLSCAFSAITSYLWNQTLSACLVWPGNRQYCVIDSEYAVNCKRGPNPNRRYALYCYCYKVNHERGWISNIFYNNGSPCSRHTKRSSSKTATSF